MKTFQCGCCLEECSELVPVVNPNFGVPTVYDLVCGPCALALRDEYFEELFRHPVAYVPAENGRVVWPHSLRARRVA